MLRRLLACLAILTGLATATTPAHARMMAVMSQSVVEGAQAQQAGPVATCEVRQQDRADLRSKVASEPRCRYRKRVVIVIPTIQLGPDRALE
jgi:hypothetical protein